MEIRLPKRSGGMMPLLLKDVRQVTVIGANGAGKSRFCSKIMQEVGDKAFRMSALKGIHSETYHNTMPGSVESIYNERMAANSMFESKANTEFERLVMLLMADEFLELIAYKIRLRNGEHEGEPPRTKLDVLVANWQTIFPKNKVLRQSGKLLFANENGDTPYGALWLSDGEKAALYYLGSVLYAPQDAVILVDAPETFIHRSIMQTLWNVIEEMRPDCSFIYSTHDIEFASSRIANKCIWVKNFDVEHEQWEYEFLNPGETFDEELYMDLLGSRKPVVFIEGDSVHSIDSKLYSLVFTECTVKPMGSCNKVIEATRTFNELRSFHSLESRGIVDRDRRADGEVSYLRAKKIFVPNAAEVENILLLEGVVRAAAQYCHKDAEVVFSRVKRNVLKMFAADQTDQALEHTRHRVKRNVEVRIDKRFQSISELEQHMIYLINEIQPREMYEDLCERFKAYSDSGNYDMVLRVYNKKTVLGQCGVAQMCGLNSKDDYVKLVLNILKRDCKEAKMIRNAIMECFGVDEQFNNLK